MRKLSLKNCQREITIRRDNAGVPHVRADSWFDALYGLGYMHATDRSTQMLFGRSVARGRAAEEIANQPELLETDRFFRKFGLHLGLDEEVARLDSGTQRALDSYCDGINDGLSEKGRSLPMWATSYEPELWRAQSVLLVGKLLSFGGLAIGQLQNERTVLELIHAGVNDEALRELFAPRLDDVDFAMLRAVKISNQISNDALEVITDLPRLAGSNAWAVAPSRSATGHALLAADPHLEINRLPAIWYEAVLQWDDHYVMGASLPGCPLFAVARTRSVAWGVTYMRGDTVDYFVEDCRPNGTGGWQYRRDDQWHDFDVREELVARKGAEPETLVCYENEQGVIDTAPDDMEQGLHLSIAWTGNYPGSGRAITSWLDMLQAQSVEEAMGVVRQCVQPTLTWVLADREGHIGLQSCGRFPVRGNGYTGFTPIPAWDPANHWQGWVSDSELPGFSDPPEGYVASANEEMNPLGGTLLVTHPCPPYRKQRICEVLAADDSVTIARMQELQYDVVSTQSREILDVVLPAFPEGELKQRFARWDHRFDPTSTEATLFFRLYRNIMIELLGQDHGIGWRRMLYLCSRAGYSSMTLTAADRLLQKEESVWWSGRTKEDVIRAAAKRLENESDAPWSKINFFHFADRFFGNHHVGRILGFKSRRYAMRGCHATPFQGHVLQTATRESTFAPSYHLVTDLGTDEAHTNLPGGPSESRFSKWYKSDIARWLSAEYKVLRLDDE